MLSNRGIKLESEISPLISYPKVSSLIKLLESIFSSLDFPIFLMKIRKLLPIHSSVRKRFLRDHSGKKSSSSVKVRGVLSTFVHKIILLEIWPDPVRLTVVVSRLQFTIEPEVTVNGVILLLVHVPLTRLGRKEGVRICIQRGIPPARNSCWMAKHILRPDSDFLVESSEIRSFSIIYTKIVSCPL